MSTISYAPTRLRARLRAPSIPRPELLGLLALAGVLYLWALSRNGWANEYYSAAVRSMASSWHDFIYGSFDSSGVMTVDKPPAALWVQALSVRIFGFHSLSVLVPQALMGMASVGLVYDLTRRQFGRMAGFAAGLVLALTPVTVAISRHNNPDALLVLCCVAALWFLVRALEDGRMRWIVLTGAAVGLGFEAKMGAALLIVPALAAAWLWVAPHGRLAAARQLLAGGAAMVVVGGAWPLLMALTPASDRPWIAGTSDNSIWSLITGYNGLGRLTGQAGGPAGAGGGPGGGGNNGFFGGSTGPFRLLNEALGGQAGWLLGFALVAGIAVVVVSRLRRDDLRSGWVIAAGGSFLTIAVAFSWASGIFHPYYVSQLAPFIAALVGAGVAQLVAPGNAMRVLAPIAVAAGVITELIVLGNDSTGLGWLPPLLVLAGLGAVAALWAWDNARVRAAVLAVALGVLLIAPATWAADTLGHPTNGTFPAGGPEAAGRGGPAGGPGPGGFRGGAPGPPPGAFGGGGFAPRGGGGFGGPSGGGGIFGSDQSLAQAAQYVEQHGGGTIAVSSQTSAAQQILDSDVNVAGLGGFSGRESEVSATWLAQAVRSGQIRWVLTDGGGAGGLGVDGRVGSRSIMALVAEVGKPVSYGGSQTLYDLQAQADALLAAGSGVSQ
jgi:4-amino-4-deoxy-L-arabinose transferase-like glycosyltransferase